MTINKVVFIICSTKLLFAVCARGKQDKPRDKYVKALWYVGSATCARTSRAVIATSANSRSQTLRYSILCCDRSHPACYHWNADAFDRFTHIAARVSHVSNAVGVIAGTLIFQVRTFVSWWKITTSVICMYIEIVCEITWYRSIFDLWPIVI